MVNAWVPLSAAVAGMIARPPDWWSETNATSGAAGEVVLPPGQPPGVPYGNVHVEKAFSGRPGITGYDKAEKNCLKQSSRPRHCQFGPTPV